MIMQITTVERFCNFGYTFVKNSHFGHFVEILAISYGKYLATLV